MLRLVRPFGEASALDQLLVEIVAGAEPSADLTRLTPLPPELPATSAAPPRLTPTATLVLLAVLAIVAVLLANR
jgi:hypothetical protein